MFKLWSEINTDSKESLNPDLGLRNWGDLKPEEKQKIWHYLDWYFFDAQIKEQYGMMGGVEKRFYEFYGEYREKEYKQKAIHKSILYLNENYKAKSFADSYLKNPNLNTACYDFHNIFMNQNEVVVMELLSAYAKFLYEFTKNDAYIDNLLSRINDVFLQFGIKYHLTRDGFVPRQDEKIIEEIYEPVLDCLSDPKWKEVNTLLADTFLEYRKNTPQAYSNCVTNTVSTVQAFLQIIVNGKTGRGDISKLIPEAQKKNLIPNDTFTVQIFSNIESVLARERQETSIAHPKKQYANEKNARLVLNLAMVFFQHCIQK